MRAFEDTPADNTWRSFEASWRANVAPDLWDAIAAVGAVPNRSDLAAEFAMMDLEWRWRNNVTDQPRNFSHYIDLLSYLQLKPQHLVSLVEHELIVRSRWGDAPTICQLTAGLPDDGGALAKVLLATLDENFPVFVRVMREGKRLLEARSQQTCCLGRQKSNEPGKFTAIENDDHTRFVIADSDSVDIANEFVSVTRTAVKQAIVHVGNGIPCICGDQQLPSNADTLLTLPCKIQIGDLTLAIDCKF